MSAWRKSGTIGAAVTVGGALVSGLVLGSGSAPNAWGDVATANPRQGVQGNVLAPGLTQTSVAWGALPLTNPDAAAGITHYGYDTSAGGPLTQDQHEAFKTEPDKNVYLTFGSHHYLFQGHEGGRRGYVTRIDLDQADPALRVSLVADADASGAPLPTFDGITWDPFSKQLLLTAESKAPNGGVWAVGLDDAGAATGAAVRLPALGSGGYEGVQNDSDGNVWLVEDIGGPTVAGTNGKKPNSYVYRFRPTDRTDLTRGGTLEALQVARADGTPVTAAQLGANPSDAFIGQLHTYRTSFATTWVPVHAGTDAFDATAAAAAAGATPFKRPENGVFRPGTSFTEFYFTETGDTNAASTLPGAFGGVFRLTQAGPSAATGTLSAAFLGDVAHTGLDNLAFGSAHQLLVVEDAGDTLHGQRDALDSGWAIDLHGADGHHRVTRWLAEGRDPSATYDALTSPGYNDGDNEVTGIHVSDGDPSVAGLLGAKVPDLSTPAWRGFWTQQHGDNVTWEFAPAARAAGHGHH